MWGTLSYVEGFCLFEGTSNTQLSQNFPPAAEVGGIYKCVIYIRCPGTAEHAEYPDSEQLMREMYYCHEGTGGKRAALWAGPVVYVSLQFSTPSSLLQVLLLSLVEPPGGMPSVCGLHGCC